MGPGPDVVSVTMMPPGETKKTTSNHPPTHPQPRHIRESEGERKTVATNSLYPKQTPFFTFQREEGEVVVRAWVGAMAFRTKGTLGTESSYLGVPPRKIVSTFLLREFGLISRAAGFFGGASVLILRAPRNSLLIPYGGDIPMPVESGTIPAIMSRYLNPRYPG